MVKKPEDEVVVPLSRFRRSAESVPEIGAAPPPPTSDAGRFAASAKPPVDLSDRPKIWFLLSSNGGGKTTYARWLVNRAEQAGSQLPLMAALDPGDRSLASWFNGVDQPTNRDTRNTARWLRDYLDFVASEKRSAILDFGGGGETALAALLAESPDLHSEVEASGSAVVACYPLTPRVTDIFVARDMEAAGFQPAATMLLLNEGRSDTTRPPVETFADITHHSAFRAIVTRGAQVVWMPALDSEVIEEIEKKQLPFAMARDGQVPEGKTFFPIGGLRRSAVGRFLAMAEQRHASVHTWLI